MALRHNADFSPGVRSLWPMSCCARKLTRSLNLSLFVEAQKHAPEVRSSSPLPTRSHDYRRGSALSVLSYVHQLFHVDQGQLAIHTQRWQDRPRQGPRCQSQDSDSWGQYPYRPGGKRSWCNGCKRPFNDLTEPRLHRSKRPLSYWILAPFLLCLACATHRSRAGCPYPDQVSLVLVAP